MDKISINEILKYLDGELEDIRKQEIEKLLLDDLDYGKMFVALSNLRQELGGTAAIKVLLQQEQQEMIRRVIGE